MRAEQLRLGNWVEYFGKYYKLDSVTEKGTWINVYSGTSGVFWSELNPIHLTEEILLKCGFEYIESKKVYKLYLPNDNQLLIGFNFQNELRLCYKVFNVDLVEINYLHQLQNLYFALTNQELNIEL